TDLEWPDQPQEQGIAEEAEVLLDSLRSNIGTKRPRRLARQEERPRSLSNVAAGQAEHLFEQGGIALPAAFAQAQIMLDDPSNDRLVELIGEVGPLHVGTLVNQGIPSTLREPLKGAI